MLKPWLNAIQTQPRTSILTATHRRKILLPLRRRCGLSVVVRHDADLAAGDPLGGGVGRHEEDGHVGRRDDGVEPPHGEQDVDVAELQFLVGAESEEPPADVERPRIGEEIGRALEHELRRLHRVFVLLDFAGGKDHPRGLRVPYQWRSQRAGDVVPHNYQDRREIETWKLFSEG